MVKPVFTTIIYQTKDRLKLSIVEYCLVDIIGRLSNSPEYPYCLLSQDELAKNIGISTRQTIRLIKKLISEGYLEQEPTIKKLRATQKWINNTDLNKSDKMSDDVTKCHTDSDKMSDQPCDKMSHYNNSNNNNINNKTLVLHTNGAKPLKVDKRDPSIQECIDFLVELQKFPLRKETLNRYALKRLLSVHDVSQIKRGIKYGFLIRGEDRYAPKVYNYMDLEDKWANLIDYGRQRSKTKAVNVEAGIAYLASKKASVTVV
jgi:hypothetical protein